MSFKEQLKAKQLEHKAEVAARVRDKKESRRKKPDDYEAPPDLRNFEVPLRVVNELTALMADHLEITEQQAELKKAKDVLSARLKEICTQYSIPRFQTDGIQTTMYDINQSRVSVEKLLKMGVPIKTIHLCSNVTTSVGVRVSTVKDDSNYED